MAVVVVGRWLLLALAVMHLISSFFFDGRCVYPAELLLNHDRKTINKQ